MLFEIAERNATHYIFAVLGEAQVLERDVVQPRLMIVFVSGTATSWETMRFARLTKEHGVPPPKETVFAEAHGVVVESFGITVVDGLRDGLPSVVARIWRTYGLTHLANLSLPHVDQYTFHIQKHLIFNYLQEQTRS